MRKFIFACLAGLGILSYSCQQEEHRYVEPYEPKDVVDIDDIKSMGDRILLKPIPIIISTKYANLEAFSEGYLCSSPSSSVKAEVYINEEEGESVSFLLDDDGEVVCALRFRIDASLSESACLFTTFNEYEQPLMSGIFNQETHTMTITELYNDELRTKASAAAWGCGLAVGAIGGVWSVAAGAVSAGAGFVVGMAYTAMAIAVCDGL